MDAILALLCMGLSISTIMLVNDLIVEYSMMIIHYFSTANGQTIINIGNNKSDMYTLLYVVYILHEFNYTKHTLSVHPMLFLNQALAGQRPVHLVSRYLSCPQSVCMCVCLCVRP